MTGSLRGWTVVVTRPEGPAGPLGSLLRRVGARVVLAPTVAIGPPPDPGPLDQAVTRIEDYDWIVLTSARAVAALTDRLPEPPKGPYIATVGPSTAKAAREAGWPVRVEGPGSGGAALARALLDSSVQPGDRILFPCSDRARRELTDTLQAAECTVDHVVAYQTRVPQEAPSALGLASSADAVIFTSPSAVDGWQTLLGDRFSGSLDAPYVIAIGSTTRGRLEELGVRARQAPEATFEGITRCLLDLRGSDADRVSPNTRSSL